MDSVKEDTYEYTDTDFIYQTAPWVDKNASQLSKFDRDLFQRWDKAMEEGAFRYTVDHTITRVIPGPNKYLCHLNQLRRTDRRKPQVITCLKQPFNPENFNFTKVKDNEIIFHLKKKSCTTGSKVLLNGDATERPSNCLNGETSTSVVSNDSDNSVKHDAEEETSHTVLINISPLDHGHCLLTPDRKSCYPQVMTQRAITVALETSLLSQHRGFCLGFNSLCAFASVNHLHFHIFYVEHEVIAHYSPVRHLAGKIFEFTALPTPAYALQLYGSSIEEIARLVFGITSHLHENDVAHNVFICRGSVFGEERTSSLTTVRIYIWPRTKYIGDSTHEAFNLACIELPGYLAFKDPDAYSNYTEEDVDAYFINGCLPPSQYEAIKTHIIKMGQEHSSVN